MSRPYDQIAHENWVRESCIKHARKINPYNRDVNKTIEDAKVIERYVRDIQPAAVLTYVECEK